MDEIARPEELALPVAGAVQEKSRKYNGHIYKSKKDGGYGIMCHYSHSKDYYIYWPERRIATHITGQPASTNYNESGGRSSSSGKSDGNGVVRGFTDNDVLALLNLAVNSSIEPDCPPDYPERIEMVRKNAPRWLAVKEEPYKGPVIKEETITVQPIEILPEPEIKLETTQLPELKPAEQPAAQVDPLLVDTLVARKLGAKVWECTLECGATVRVIAKSEWSAKSELKKQIAKATFYQVEYAEEE